MLAAWLARALLLYPCWHVPALKGNRCKMAKATKAVKAAVVAKVAKGGKVKVNAASIATALQTVGIANGIQQQVPTPAAAVAKLTKRSPVLVGQVLVATAKPVKVRAPHVQQAWAAVVAALPATATVLAQLPQLAHPQCVSPQGFISYMLRRGYLQVKG